MTYFLSERQLCNRIAICIKHAYGNQPNANNNDIEMSLVSRAGAANVTPNERNDIAATCTAQSIEAKILFCKMSKAD